MKKSLKQKSSNIKEKMSLQNTIIFIVICATVVSLVVSATLIRNYVIEQEHRYTKDKIKIIADLTATNNEVESALKGLSPKENIQALSLDIAKTGKLDFVVVLDKDLIRLSHPEDNHVGKPFSNLPDAKKSLSGKGHYSTKTGVLGDGIRYFSPVKDDNGDVIGIVCVGFTLETIHNEVAIAQSKILLGLLLGLLVGIFGAIFLAKKIKAVLFGLEPKEIATRLEEKEIIENEVSEGIIAIDRDKKIVLINREASNLFAKMNLEKNVSFNDTIEKHLYYVFFKNTFHSQMKHKDQTLHINGIEVVASISPTFFNETFSGAVCTFRDQSEMQHLIDELSGTEQYIDSLRAQTHEFMNKMHVIMGLIELKKYDEVAEFIKQLNLHYVEEVGYVTEKIKTPSVAGFILGKISEADEQDVSVVLADFSYLPDLKTDTGIHLLLQILGNLLDNAIEAVKEQSVKQVELLINYDSEGHIFVIQVTDTGTGITKDIQDKIFERGFSTKSDQRGFGLNLVHRTVEKQQGFIEVTQPKNLGTRFYIELPHEMELEE